MSTDKLFKMKKIILLLSIVVFFSACSDFLVEDTSSIMSADSDVMKTEKGLNSALVGMYKPLSYTWRTGLGNSSTQGVCMGDDILTTHKAANKADFREFDQFNVTDINYRLAFIWDGAYKSIQGANLIIDNYQDATGDQDVINQIAGEAYYLRAYNYFWIARMWEKAPLMLHSQNFELQSLSVESSDQQTLYDQIISDCDAALATMTSDTRIQPGRAGKASVLALKAEALLHMAGYPLKQTDKYAEAAKVAKELIDNKTKYGVALMDDFADLWQAENDGNSEEIFALTFLGTSENWNGNALYGSANRPGDEGGWDDIMCEISFFTNYPEQYRKDVTFKSSIETKRKGKTIHIPWTEFKTGRPYFKKFEGEANNWYLGQSLPLERFAEVYFIYAEAEVMSGGNKAAATEAVNKIVRRAYHEPLNTPGTHDYSADQLTQDVILQEKAYEFAGEWVRWFDLVRTEKVEQANASKNADDLQPIGGIDKSDYFMPIPATETQVNKNL